MRGEPVPLGGLRQHLVDLLELVAAQVALVGERGPRRRGHALGAADPAATVLGHGRGNGLGVTRAEVGDIGVVVGDRVQQRVQVRGAEGGGQAQEHHRLVPPSHLGLQELTQVRLTLRGLLLEPHRPVLGPQEAPSHDLVDQEHDVGDDDAAVLVDVPAPDLVAPGGLEGLPRNGLLHGHLAVTDQLVRLLRAEPAEGLLTLTGHVEPSVSRVGLNGSGLGGGGQ